MPPSHTILNGLESIPIELLQLGIFLTLYIGVEWFWLVSLCSIKQMMGPAPHTQLDADLASGMGMPDNGPKLMSM